ncbi:hypothetical protein [Phocaeicola sp. HCN-6420]|uniref:hypothetical protein n=1 Tax=Phocaeicola sp. HCN-6420 TaxID=3134673 RepID=UPI0030BBE8E0
MQINLASDKLYATDRKTHIHASIMVLCYILSFSRLADAKAMYHAWHRILLQQSVEFRHLYRGSLEVCKSDNMV